MKHLYRAVDRLGHTVDFLLMAKRDVAAAPRFFERAFGIESMYMSCKGQLACHDDTTTSGADQFYSFVV